MSEFTVNGETFPLLDEDGMTFAEADAIERVTGHSFQEIQKDENVSGSVRVIQAFVWVSMKRKKPELKFSDLGDIPMGSIEWSEEEPSADEPDPTQPDAEAGEPSDS